MKLLPVFLITVILALLIIPVQATTDTFYASTVADGRITNTSSANYYTKRLSDGNSLDTAGTSGLMTVTGISFTTPALTSDSLVRFIWSADTSSLPDDASISGAFWCMESESGSLNGAGDMSVGITKASPGTPSTLAVGDYDTVTSDLYSDTYISYATWTAAPTGDRCFALNAAGLAAISKTAYTSLSLRLKDDILNTTAEITDNTSAYTILKGYDSQISDSSMKPYLNVTYTSSGGGAGLTFTTNASTTNAPRANIAFSGVSGVTSPTAYKWEYKDYSGYTTNGYTVAPSPVWNTFSTSASTVYAWGAGNWSIRLTVTNATAPYINNSVWVNVSAGALGGTTLPTSSMYPANAIWNVEKNTLSVDSHSSAWFTGLNAVSAYDRLGFYVYSTSGITGYVVNTSAMSTQRVTSSGTYYYDANSLIPIPDDMYVEYNSDRHCFLLDTANDVVYELYGMGKNANGTWSGSPNIWNTSNYRYRMGGNTFLGQQYWYTYPTTTRTNQTPIWSASMSGTPQSAGMITYQEIAAGQINHSLFLTSPSTNGTAIWPAVAAGYWYPSVSNGETYGAPPTGAFLRLKSTYDVEAHGHGTQAKVILHALQLYGGYIAENICAGAMNCGSSFQVVGYKNANWNQTDLETLYTISLSNFEFVDTRPLIKPEDWASSSTCIVPWASEITGYKVCYTMETNTTVEDNAPTFTQNRPVVRIPATVTFMDTTVGAPTSWAWDFGDGTTSTSQNPSHRYTKPGRFNTTLTTAGGVAYKIIIVVGGGDQQFTLKDNRLFVNLESGTYTASRELSEQEKITVLNNMYDYLG